MAFADAPKIRGGKWDGWIHSSARMWAPTDGKYVPGAPGKKPHEQNLTGTAARPIVPMAAC